MVIGKGFLQPGEEKDPPPCDVGRADMALFQYVNRKLTKSHLHGVWTNCKNLYNLHIYKFSLDLEEGLIALTMVKYGKRYSRMVVEFLQKEL